MAAPIISLNGRWGGKLRDQPLDITSGDDVTLEVTVLETDDSAKDIAGATITWELSRRAGMNARVTKTATITGATTGVFQVAVDSTGELAGEYYHEAEMTESGGAISTVMRGRVNISRDTVNAS